MQRKDILKVTFQPSPYDAEIHEVHVTFTPEAFAKVCDHIRSRIELHAYFTDIPEDVICGTIEDTAVYADTEENTVILSFDLYKLFGRQMGLEYTAIADLKESPADLWMHAIKPMKAMMTA